ncbi:hypothetical protein OC842_000615 [Tilletia horrida]|uniref:Cryptochrome DASH n=1 Tax=Tilletia horrida TaxID=155126 RepID=A0AAN6GHU0_9BASI|nr:hypothetical protein OC842_000615 [Tilletia horrida]
MAASKGNVLIALLRNDLRVHDHPIFHVASSKGGQQQQQHSPLTASLRFSQPITHLLPVYVLDPVFVPLSGLSNLPAAIAQQAPEPKTRTLSLWRTSPHRLSYLAHSLADLAQTLQGKGSALHVYAGRSERVISHLVKRIEADGYRVEGVAMTKEVNSEELRTQSRVRKALEAASSTGNGRKPRVFTTEAKPLVPRNILPFELRELPDVYTQFRKRVEGIRPDEGSSQYMGAVLEPLPTPDKLLPPPDTVPDQADDAYLLDGKDSRASLSDVQTLIQQLIKPILDSPTLGIAKGAALQTEAAQNDEKVGQGGGQTAQVPSAFPFKGGETEALQRLKHYLDGPNAPGVRYKETRNGMLGEDYSTKFAAALAHGTISPRTIAVHALAMDEASGKPSGGGYWVVFELLWRDYFYYVGARYRTALFQLDGIAAAMPSKAGAAAQENYPAVMGNKRADVDGWVRSKTLEDKEDFFVRWAEGRTGVPLIDANMRELIQTGFMSNRGRQNVASFLTKDLGYDWRYGAELFESLLTDYDTNSNWGNWQYVAGVGNDPRSSRQFNPIKQAHDYDAQGDYVKSWLPELRSVPAHAVQHPWTLNLTQQGIDIGTYPGRPIVENKGMWQRHYWRDGAASSSRGGGGGGGGGRGGGGRGGGGGGGGGYRGRGGGRGGRGGGGGRGGRGRGGGAPN